MKKRLNELESRLTFQDDTIQELNKVLIHQQNQIDNLVSQVEQLKHYIQSMEPPTMEKPSEPPPHY